MFGSPASMGMGILPMPQFVFPVMPPVDMAALAASVQPTTSIPSTTRGQPGVVSPASISTAPTGSGPSPGNISQGNSFSRFLSGGLFGGGTEGGAGRARGAGFDDGRKRKKQDKPEFSYDAVQLATSGQGLGLDPGINLKNEPVGAQIGG